jgi:bacterioferritin-associated ferredoxin
VLVCHCRRVSDAQIASAVSAVAVDPRSVVRAVVRQTHAGTGCGGCLQSLRAVIEQALGPTARSADATALAG